MYCRCLMWHHVQSLMGDGWHCGSIQWLFDKLKEISGE